jgi:hypothetical protein
MRARGIKPGFFKNAELADLQPMTRLLFAGLWMLADRRGRMMDRPRQIKGEVFPFDESGFNIEDGLNELAAAGFIQRYTVDGGKYLQVHNFDRHQRIHPGEKESLIPEPPKVATLPESDNYPTSPEITGANSMIYDICIMSSDVMTYDTDSGQAPEPEPADEQESIPEQESEPAPKPDPVAEVFQAWNDMATTHGLPKARRDTSKYVKACKQRLKESEFREQWRNAIPKVPENPWNMGENPGGWRADIEWFLRSGQTSKILGRIEPRAPTHTAKGKRIDTQSSDVGMRGEDRW